MKKRQLFFGFLAIFLSHSLSAYTYTITNNATQSIYGKIRPAHLYIQLFFGKKKGPKVSLRSGETKEVDVANDLASACLTDIKMAHKPYEPFGKIGKICRDATITIDGTYPHQTATVQ